MASTPRRTASLGGHLEGIAPAMPRVAGDAVIGAPRRAAPVAAAVGAVPDERAATAFPGPPPPTEPASVPAPASGFSDVAAMAAGRFRTSIPRGAAAPAPSPADRSSDHARTPARRLRLATSSGRESPSRARRDRPVAGPPRGFYAGFGKRLLDVVLVLLAAPVALPLTLILASWVRLDPRSGRAPAFFGQVRVGRGGRRFICWKIRTMRPQAEAALTELLARDAAAAEEWARCQKLARDPRIVPAGRLLRASSLDELPQLWNVLRGEMSLVGPRPYTPDQRTLHPEPETYEGLRPGLSGYWQVGPRGEGGDFARRGVEDARYRREISLVTDLRVLLRTATVVMAGSGR